jgi:hypothetical protein
MAPRCFMHVPKSAGSSVTESLRNALPEGAVSPLRHDVSNLCGVTDFDALPPVLREILVADRRDLEQIAASDVVCGHFSLPLLRRVTSIASIATILREPRSRLLSLYAYWAVEDLSFCHPYDAHLRASQSLGDFLDDAFVAPVTDNQVCRMLLRGDPRIPEEGFIAPADAETLAANCVELLDGFGFVGIQERSRAAWEGLSAFFGVELMPERVNVTGDLHRTQRCPSVRGTVGADTFATIDARTEVDRRIYDVFLQRDPKAAADAGRIAEVAYMRQLIELGAVLGREPVR